MASSVLGDERARQTGERGKQRRKKGGNKREKQMIKEAEEGGDRRKKKRKRSQIHNCQNLEVAKPSSFSG